MSLTNSPTDTDINPTITISDSISSSSNTITLDPCALYPNGAMIKNSNGTTTGTTYKKTLSPEEETELLVLEQDYKIQKTLFEQNAFKQLPPTLRQWALFNIEWTQFLDDMRSTFHPKCERLNELLQTTVWTRTSRAYDIIYNNSKITEYLTVNDLRQAHADASIEEEILSSAHNKI